MMKMKLFGWILGIAAGCLSLVAGAQVWPQFVGTHRYANAVVILADTPCSAQDILDQLAEYQQQGSDLAAKEHYNASIKFNNGQVLNACWTPVNSREYVILWIAEGTAHDERLRPSKDDGKT